MPVPFPIRCKGNVGSGFLVTDASSVWLVTCVHLITGLKETPPQLSLFEGAIIHCLTKTVDVAVLSNGIQRFSCVICESDGNLFDVLAIKLTSSEIFQLISFGAYGLNAVKEPIIAQAVTAAGFPRVAFGDYFMETIDAQIERVHDASIVLSAPSAPGMSGGPLLADGGLIGIIHGDLGAAAALSNALAIAFKVVASDLFS